MTQPGRPAGVLCCGLATLDVVQTVDALPGPDEKVVARDLLVAAGGPAANAAATCAALGVTARLLTRVGGTSTATLVHADLARRGVDVRDLASPAASPAVSTVLVTAATGQRAVVSVNATGRRDGARTPPSAGASVAEGVTDDLPHGATGHSTDGAVHDALDGVDVVLLDGHHLDLALAVARAARRCGVPVLLDGGSWKPGLEALLAHVDVAVLSADFRPPAPHDGDVLAVVGALGPAVVAQSHGPGPVVVADGARRTEVPVPSTSVVDTLGAGDVLHGALAAWTAVRGPQAPVTQALAFAAGVASASCAAAGAHGWTADDDVLARWRDRLRIGGDADVP